MPKNLRSNDNSIKFLENFVCAGSSALLISFAHLYPEFWFVSLFALVPFLWRIKKLDLSESMVLGIILASCYSFVVYPDEILITPKTFLFKFFFINVIFSIFSITVNKTRKYIGFNPIFIAIFWLPLEYVLVHHTGLENIFTFKNSDSWFVLRFSLLFGSLMLSFCIVLINSLILMFVEYIQQRVFSSDNPQRAEDKKSYSWCGEVLPERILYYFRKPRAPPAYRPIVNNP